MVGVGDQKRLLIEKDRLRLLERYPMLAPVFRILAVIPLKSKHARISPTIYLQCNDCSFCRTRLQSAISPVD